ncbi:MAG TPA: acyl carrier protein [Kineosporiaceae bacterium]|nr:acyl carrier protein [Kineosporiaceae bacterium]
MTPTSAHTLTDQQRDLLRAIVVEVLEIEGEELTEAGSLVDDHGADSLLAIEILARIERDLSVDVPQEELSEMGTLGGIYAVVARHSGGGRHA